MSLVLGSMISWRMKDSEAVVLSTDPKKIRNARRRITLAIKPDVYAYIVTEKTDKVSWEVLARTFDDKGLTRKVNLFVEVFTTKLENCRSMEDYVSRISKLYSYGLEP
ncbi:hypothetical protein TSAR_003877 [Trichomalopsis sarcophagae]|uniref:Uncharacterized protein n=1 Tax=Trichomalopsis sarcophagae TaxID=543379 RepID=A0A232F439_9HYME|nr:hypothetical protein TSAR_003877 [Trichomalopsis sarcophagae]